MRIFNGETMELVRQNFVTDAESEARYGFKTWTFHRVDLHRGLMDLAFDPNKSENKAAVLRLQSQVVDVDCEDGIITLENGEKIKKDLIVGADGLRVRSNSLAPAK